MVDPLPEALERQSPAPVPLKRDSSISLGVARHLAALGSHGSIRSHHAPDDPERVRLLPKGVQSVDLSATSDDGTVFALEHTKIESYAGQLTDFEQMEKILLPLEVELTDQLPSNRRYRLVVGMGAVADKSLDPAAIRAALTPWIVENALALLAAEPGEIGSHEIVREADEVLPFDVTLSAWPPSPEGGSLDVLRTTSSDADRMMELRVLRTQKALSKKLPKLLASAPARTVLVLEDQDMATSNMSLVWTALRRASVGVVLCDTVVVVETWLEHPTGTIVYDSGVWLDHFSQNTFVVQGLAAAGDG